MKRSSWWTFASFGGLCAVAALVNNGITKRNLPWYRRLKKPRYQAPEYLFGPVWTTLYTLISLSATRVARSPSSKPRSRALSWWAAQLAANAAWSPLFFGAHRPRLALADMVVLAGAILAYINEARKVDRPAAWMMAPYLGWIGFAASLNAGIVLENRQLRG